MHRAGQLLVCCWPSGARAGRAQLVLCCELLRGEVAEAGMGTFAIVGDALAFDLAAGIVERKEDVLIETLFSQPRIETLYVGVLDRLARRDKL